VPERHRPLTLNGLVQDNDSTLEGGEASPGAISVCPDFTSTPRQPKSKKSHFQSKTMPELPARPNESIKPNAAGANPLTGLYEAEMASAASNLCTMQPLYPCHSGSLIICRGESVRTSPEERGTRKSRRRHSSAAVPTGGEEAIAAEIVRQEAEAADAEAGAENADDPELISIREISTSGSNVRTSGWTEYRALLDFTGEGEHELSFKKGQRVLIAGDEEIKGWLKGRVSGRTGYVPGQFVEKAPESATYTRDALTRLGKMLPLNYQRHEIERIRADASNAEDNDEGERVCEYCGVEGRKRGKESGEAGRARAKTEEGMKDEGIALSEDRVQFLEAISTTLQRMGRIGGKPAELTVPEAKMVLFAQIHRGPTGTLTYPHFTNRGYQKLTSGGRYRGGEG
jgi:hypothetical protein